MYRGDPPGFLWVRIAFTVPALALAVWAIVSGSEIAVWLVIATALFFNIAYGAARRRNRLRP